MNPGSALPNDLDRVVQCQIVGHFRTMGLAAAEQILGRRERAVHILGGERFHQAPEREVGHWKTRRLPADEQARHAKVIQPYRDRETGRSAGQMEIEQDEVGLIVLCRRDRAVGIFGHGDDPVPRIVLDEIFECDRQLAVIFDDEDIQH